MKPRLTIQSAKTLDELKRALQSDFTRTYEDLTKTDNKVADVQTTLDKTVQRVDNSKKNIDLLGTRNNSNYGGGDGVVGLFNSTKVPTSNPVGGSFMYVQGGATKLRGSSGTVTTISPAEPHCPVCGADYMAEFENEKYGYFAMCLKCLADELGSRPWIVRK